MEYIMTPEENSSLAQLQKYFNYALCGLIEIDENYYTEFVRIV